MSEKNVTLISKNYAENVFVTEPQLQTKLSKKQDDVGLSIGDDGNVVIDMKGITQAGGPFENIFDGFTYFQSGVDIQGRKPVLDVTSSDDSVTVTRSADGYGVDLKANGGGSIDENRVITGRYETFGYDGNRFVADSKIDVIRLKYLSSNTDIGTNSINIHSEDGDANADFTVHAFVSAFTPSVTISIPCDEYGGYTAITSNRGTEIMSFKHDTSAGYDTHNTKIYFNTPAYFNTIYISDSDSFNYSAKAMYYDPFMDGTLRIGDDSFCDTTIVGLGAVSLYAKTNVNLDAAIVNLGAAVDGGFNISIGNTTLYLDQAKLQKLKQLLES